MPEQNNVKLAGTNLGRKMPLDTRIIGWLVFIDALVHLFFALLLLSGFGYFPSPGSRAALFGTVFLVSEIPSGVYSFCLGIVGALAAYGIIKRLTFGWWLTLIYLINNIFDLLPKFSVHWVSISIWICISLGIVAWLICRRRLYNISIKTKKLEA